MTAAVERRGETSLRAPMVASATLHVVLVAAFLLTRAAPHAPMPPTYRVSLVAAPPGPRQIGVVQPASPAPAAPQPTPQPARPPAPTPAAPPAASKAHAPKSVAAPKAGKTPRLATPTTAPTTTKPASPTAPAPVAGGGPQGGKGADVANVHIEGIEFNYPGYLENVVRQIAIRFKPPRGRDLQAVVAFLIRRDGTVTGIRLTQRSGVYAFDTEAMGAVDAAANAHAFGALPAGFADDVLPVIFSFDPRLIR